MEKRMSIEELSQEVRQIAYGVHVYLGNGYLEKVYENCMKHRLEKAGFEVESQKNLKVFDEDGYLIGDYFADLVVDKRLIVELKSVKALTGEHYAQTLNYLKITGFDLALLVNFGAYKFETRTVVPNFGHRDAPCRGGEVEKGEPCRGGEVEKGGKGRGEKWWKDFI